MTHWILNFTRGGTKLKKLMPEQAQKLLEIGLWGIPETAQARRSLAPGDRVLVYVGAPDRIFIGDATIASGWHEWTKAEGQDEATQYAEAGTFGAGIALSNCRIWDTPVELGQVWPRTQGASRNPNAV